MFELFKPKNYGKVVDADLKKLTDKGSVWAGVNAQDLRAGGKPEVDYKHLYDMQVIVSRSLAEMALSILELAESKIEKSDDVNLTRLQNVRTAVNKVKAMI